MSGKRPPLVCSIGHHVWTLPCKICRAVMDRRVNNFFKRLSAEMLASCK